MDKFQCYWSYSQGVWRIALTNNMVERILVQRQTCFQLFRRNYLTAQLYWVKFWDMLSSHRHWALEHKFATDWSNTFGWHGWSVVVDTQRSGCAFVPISRSFPVDILALITADSPAFPPITLYHRSIAFVHVPVCVCMYLHVVSANQIIVNCLFSALTILDMHEPIPNHWSRNVCYLIDLC